MFSRTLLIFDERQLLTEKRLTTIPDISRKYAIWPDTVGGAVFHIGLLCGDQLGHHPFFAYFLTTNTKKQL